MDLVALSARIAGVIASEYDADDSDMAYSAIDTRQFGFGNRDVIVGDELGFKGIPVGLLVEDLQTEEIWEIYRGTRVVVQGPNEWLVDGQILLEPCPWAPGAKTHSGFTDSCASFRLLSGRPFPATQGAGGHSLAAAWALLRAAQRKATLISFAGPKVGDRAFSDFALQAIPLLVRWVNHPDYVPKVPLMVWPCFEYMHAGPANEFDSSAKFRPGLSLKDAAEAYHSIHTYWNAVQTDHPIDPRFALP